MNFGRETDVALTADLEASGQGDGVLHGLCSTVAGGWEERVGAVSHLYHTAMRRRPVLTRIAPHEFPVDDTVLGCFLHQSGGYLGKSWYLSRYFKDLVDVDVMAPGLVACIRPLGLPHQMMNFTKVQGKKAHLVSHVPSNEVSISLNAEREAFPTSEQRQRQSCHILPKLNSPQPHLNKWARTIIQGPSCRDVRILHSQLDGKGSTEDGESTRVSSNVVATHEIVTLGSRAISGNDNISLELTAILKDDTCFLRLLILEVVSDAAAMTDVNSDTFDLVQKGGDELGSVVAVPLDSSLCPVWVGVCDINKRWFLRFRDTFSGDLMISNQSGVIDPVEFLSQLGPMKLEVANDLAANCEKVPCREHTGLVAI